LADKSGRLLLCISVWFQAQALDMSMGGCAIVSLVTLHLADLDHGVGGCRICRQLLFSMTVISARDFDSCSGAIRDVMIEMMVVFAVAEASKYLRLKLSQRAAPWIPGAFRRYDGHVRAE
jgi:hypothetical protein